MDKSNKIKELVNKKKTGMEEGNTKLVSNSNKSLNNIINDGITKAQQILGKENKYKKYFIENKEYIREQFAINKDVISLSEAIGIINNKIDFRYIFGLDVLMERPFNCEFVNNEQSISFAFKTEKEADEAVDKEIEKNITKEISTSGFKRFGMYVKQLVIKGGGTEAWISYSSSRNKCLYMIGNKDKDNYVVTNTFDILDLYQIFMNCNFQKAVQELCELFKIRINYIEVVRDKYNQCKNFVRDNLTKSKYPTLYELIWEHSPKLEVILNDGIEKLYYNQECNGYYVFSSSMGYLSTIMKKSKSTINSVINTYALLGLVEKPDMIGGKYSNWNRNQITNFCIPEYNEELFQKAEKLAKIMLYGEGERITATAFSYSLCIKKFGQTIANLIFKDKVTKAKVS